MRPVSEPKTSVIENRHWTLRWLRWILIVLVGKGWLFIENCKPQTWKCFSFRSLGGSKKGESESKFKKLKNSAPLFSWPCTQNPLSQSIVNFHTNFHLSTSPRDLINVFFFVAALFFNRFVYFASFYDLSSKIFPHFLLHRLLIFLLAAYDRCCCFFITAIKSASLFGFRSVFCLVFILTGGPGQC